MENLVIDFKPNGQVEALHMDAFDLGFLGDKTVRRQTDIVFHEETQAWNLEYLIHGVGRFVSETLNGFSSYDEARETEVRWLNNCRLFGIDPASNVGLRVMAGIRKHG